MSPTHKEGEATRRRAGSELGAGKFADRLAPAFDRGEPRVSARASPARFHRLVCLKGVTTLMPNHPTLPPIARVVIAIALFLLASLTVAAQPKFRIPITITDPHIASHGYGPSPSTAYFGVHPDASSCLDLDTMRGFTDRWDTLLPYGFPYTSNFAEFEGPPPPPMGCLCVDIRIRSLSPAGCLYFLAVNVHGYVSPSQIDTFLVSAQPVYTPDPDTVTYSWPAGMGDFCDSMFLVFPPGYITPRVDMTRQMKYIAMPDESGFTPT